MDVSVLKKIERRRRQLLVHSYIYYELNDSVISDSQWSEWALELEELQRNHPEESSKAVFYDEFKNFDHSTGAGLDYFKDEIICAAKLLLHNRDGNRNYISSDVIATALDPIFHGNSGGNEVTAMSAEDETINNLADILYGKTGPTVDLSPVFNGYENREELTDIKCELERISQVNEHCVNAIDSILTMYLTYGIVAESDKKLKESESTLLTLNRILNNYESYLQTMRTDLENERNRYALIFKEKEE